MTLRARLAAGLAVIVAMIAVTGWIVVAGVRSHLTEQVDNRLTATSIPSRDSAFAAEAKAADGSLPQGSPSGTGRDRFGTFYEVVLRPEAAPVVLFAPNLPGSDTTPPDLVWDEVVPRVGAPYTVDGGDGGTDYRALASLVDDDLILVRAVALDDVDETVAELTRVQVAALAVALAVCIAVGWWVIRLGIRPIEAMTETAGNVAEGDLSKRVAEPPDATTETGQLARALNTMLGRIEDAATDQAETEARLRRFVADASHELRTPITTIRGYAELYRAGGLGSQAALDDAMRRTEEEAQRMGRLIDDMLTLAKLDRLPSLDLAQVDLAAVIEDTVGDARMSAPGHGIRSSTDAGGVVLGDIDRLRQVLVNLVRNATVHTPVGTSVMVTLTTTPDHAVVEIRDDGPGMSSEDLRRAKERFYRADPSRSRDRGGTGLGLAVAAAIVTAHDGDLDLTSELGAGTTVTVTLPQRGPADL